VEKLINENAIAICQRKKHVERAKHRRGFSARPIALKCGVIANGIRFSLAKSNTEVQALACAEKCGYF
jgi:hypothetical protein